MALSGTQSNHEDFLQAQKLLTILTGEEPQIKNGKIDIFHEGEHLRFVFSGKQQSFNLVKTLLKILDIQHFSELFKNLEPREGEPQLEFYITVAKDQFAKLQSYVAPGAILTLKSDKMLNVDLLPPMQSALFKVLFDPNFTQQMKERNSAEYNLDGIMHYFANLLINSAPCFAHLKNHGMEVGFTVSLEVQEEMRRDIKEPKAITPARTNHENAMQKRSMIQAQQSKEVDPEAKRQRTDVKPTV